MGVGSQLIEEVYNCFKEKYFSWGQCIFKEAEPIDDIYIVKDGNIIITQIENDTIEDVFSDN